MGRKWGFTPGLCALQHVDGAGTATLVSVTESLEVPQGWEPPATLNGECARSSDRNQVSRRGQLSN
jgi:hypothetical protein